MDSENMIIKSSKKVRERCSLGKKSFSFKIRKAESTEYVINVDENKLLENRNILLNKFVSFLNIISYILKYLFNNIWNNIHSN